MNEIYFKVFYFIGNKQRQREREFEYENRKNEHQDHYSNTNQKPKRLASLTREELKKLGDTQIYKISPVEKQIRSDVSLINGSSNEIMYAAPLNNSKLDNIIQSEAIKHTHSPTRVHVMHKPTVTDTSRVYNPYPIKNEYDKYVKNGFIFEPFQHSNAQLNNSEVTLTKAEARRLSTSLITKPNINNANIAFSSESISPYARKDSYRNQVDADQLANFSRGYVNTQFKKETEFQNLNILKTQQIESSLENQQQIEYQQNQQEQQQQQIETTLNSKLYEDEYDIANKIKRKPENSNTKLINSINNELKKFQTGYQQNS